VKANFIVEFIFNDDPHSLMRKEETKFRLPLFLTSGESKILVRTILYDISKKLSHKTSRTDKKIESNMARLKTSLEADCISLS
jgi:hypothetical protein